MTRYEPIPQAPHRRPSDLGGVTFRRAAADEGPRLRALHELSLATLGGDDYTPQQIVAFFGSFDTAGGDMLAVGRMLVAEAHGFIVGTGGWTFAPLGDAPASADTVTLRAIFVHPLMTRQGIASRIVERLEAAARASGAARATLLATLTARRLYERLGYRVLGPRDLPLADGLTFPTLRMEKLLVGRA